MLILVSVVCKCNHLIVCRSTQRRLFRGTGTAATLPGVVELYNRSPHSVLITLVLHTAIKAGENAAGVVLKVLSLPCFYYAT